MEGTQGPELLRNFEDGTVLLPGKITAEEAGEPITNAALVVTLAGACWSSAGARERFSYEGWHEPSDDGFSEISTWPHR
jgi:hypothetical protein